MRAPGRAGRAGAGAALARAAGFARQRLRVQRLAHRLHRRRRRARHARVRGLLELAQVVEHLQRGAHLGLARVLYARVQRRARAAPGLARRLGEPARVPLERVDAGEGVARFALGALPSELLYVPQGLRRLRQVARGRRGGAAAALGLEARRGVIIRFLFEARRLFGVVGVDAQRGAQFSVELGRAHDPSQEVHRRREVLELPRLRVHRGVRLDDLVAHPAHRLPQRRDAALDDLQNAIRLVDPAELMQELVVVLAHLQRQRRVQVGDRPVQNLLRVLGSVGAARQHAAGVRRAVEVVAEKGRQLGIRLDARGCGEGRFERGGQSRKGACASTRIRAGARRPGETHLHREQRIDAGRRFLRRHGAGGFPSARPK